jgi:hypothetical protein
MTVLKWVLIVFSVLFVIGAAFVGGFFYWASGVPSVAVTEADLAVGGSYTPEERQALIDACTKRPEVKNKDSCTCIADRAGSEASRFERLVLTATLEGSPTKVVAITKGLIASGVAEEKTKELQDKSKKRFENVMKACGFPG